MGSVWELHALDDLLSSSPAPCNPVLHTLKAPVREVPASYVSRNKGNCQPVLIVGDSHY